MTKKFSWEAEPKGSALILRVEDGDKKTEWRIRRNTKHTDLRLIFDHLANEFRVHPEEFMVMPTTAGGLAGFRAPMVETVRTVDAEELAELQRDWEDQSHVSTDAVTEEGSKEALNARVAQLSKNAQWWETEDDVYMTDVPIPDYDAGEV